ncbi:MAG: hypothetical protein EB060_01760 [Proteobacteria bacterium]|nr:hypothetical protein [Pseudomonadota bacterium]
MAKKTTTNDVLDKNNPLSALRAEIDGIDDKLLALLVERAKVVEKVGKVKASMAPAEGKRSIIRPGREARMVRRMVKESDGKLPPTVVAHLWRTIISSAINIEEHANISAVATHENSECYWMAREYFGAFTPTTKRSSTMEVVRDIVEERATVGVLPVWDEESPKPWWTRLVDTENPPYVFAKLPFIKLAPSKKSPMFSIGYVQPEATDDDHSLYVLLLEETITFDSAKPHVEEILKVPFTVIEHYRQVGSPNMRYYLLDFEDYIDPKDARLAACTDRLNKKYAKNANARLQFLGAYASPIVIGTEAGEEEAPNVKAQ